MRGWIRRKEKRFAALLTAFLVLGAAYAGLDLPRAMVLAEGEIADPAPLEELTPEPTTLLPPPPEELIPLSAVEPTPEPNPEPMNTPALEATPEPAANEPEPTPEPESEEAATPEPVPVPEGEPTPEPLPETTMVPEEGEEQELPEEPEPVPGVEGTPEPTREPLPNLDDGMRIEPLYQRDYRDPIARVNGRSRSVSTSGCGAVCASMVITYLTGDTQQTPVSLFRRAVNMGEYHGYGLTHETLSVLLEENGVRSEWIPNDAAGILQALQEGKPVVAHVGPGTFTRNGHYIVLRGINDEGMILVNDPASPERSAVEYPIETFVRQARRDDAFMVCWTDEIEQKIAEIHTEQVREALPSLIAAAKEG